MIKKERGAITLFTVVICMFLLVNVLLINVGVMNKNASQEKEIAKISESYEVSQAKMEQAYQEVLESNEYPTYGQLLKLLEQAKEEAKQEAKQEAKKEVENTMNEEKLKMYPIGSIYISTKETSPSEFIGGTWERYGKGKTLVGVDENQTEFNIANKEGGQKNITLKVSQLPSHNHSIPILTGTTSQNGAHTHRYDKSNTSTGGTAITEKEMPSHTHTVKPDISLQSTFIGTPVNTTEAGNHTHKPICEFGAAITGVDDPRTSPFLSSARYLSIAGLSSTTARSEGARPTTESGNHKHTVTPEGTINNTLTIKDSTVSSTGGGQEHTHSIESTATDTVSSGLHTHELTTQASTTGNAGNATPDLVNVQDPYITVYMWQRVS